MAARRTNAQIEARRIAREKKAAADSERQRREQEIEGLMTEFFEHRIPRDDALQTVAKEERGMGAKVIALLKLGESAQRVRELLDLDDKEFKRLQQAARAKVSGTAEPTVDSARSAGSAAAPKRGTEEPEADATQAPVPVPAAVSEASA